MGRTKAWTTVRRGPGKRLETLLSAVCRVRKTLPGAKKIGKNSGFASCRAIWEHFVSEAKKSGKKSRLHCPSLRTVQRIVAEIRTSGLQKTVSKRRGIIVKPKNYYFYDRYYLFFIRDSFPIFFGPFFLFSI